MALLPSRLTIAALAGCAILLPLAIGTAWSLGVANRDKATIERAHKKLDAEVNAPGVGLRFQYAACTAERGNLQAASDAQNAAVSAMKAESDRRAAEAAKAVTEARQKQRTAEARARALLSQTPRPGESLCAAADRIILEAAR